MDKKKYLNLSNTEIVALINSCSPSYDDIIKYSKLKYGKYYGGFNDKWEWNVEYLKTLPKDTLINLYLKNI